MSHYKSSHSVAELRTALGAERAQSLCESVGAVVNATLCTASVVRCWWAEDGVSRGSLGRGLVWAEAVSVCLLVRCYRCAFPSRNGDAAAAACLRNIS